MKALLIVLTLLAGGCTATMYDRHRDEVFAHIKLVGDLPAGTYGTAQCKDGICYIEIRRESYPDCITHEIRHGFEGDWHPGRNSTKDCHRGKE